MTNFQWELIVTVLDIFAFFFVTTELYGHHLEIANAFVNDSKNEKIITTFVSIMGLMGGAQDLMSKVILWTYRNYHGKINFKSGLLIFGAILFLLARFLSLWHSYSSE